MRLCKTMSLLTCRYPNTNEYRPTIGTYAEMGDMDVHIRLMVLVSQLKKTLVKAEDIQYAVEMADMNL